ncbi:phage late control D family protein [Nocardioides gilvus]|uniref:phage late control D family protein n=1 Tax=Nocardioides gilvus TaxID=1735589 RepID=UPI000D743BE8|nr:phage late control D family protein [Nocardioides gilvus]
MTVVPALQAATPLVAVAGEGSGVLSASLEQLTVSESTEGMVTCEARFNNVSAAGSDPGFLFFDRELLDFGAEVRIDAGAGEREGTLFTGRITGLRAEFAQQGGGQLTMLAEDALQDLRMTRRTRAFEEMSDASVFEQIAADHGLGAEVDLPGPVHRVVAQVDQSDLALLRGRARPVGAEVWLGDRTLHVARRSSRRGQPVVLSNRQNLREASLVADLAGQRTSFAVSGWDPSTKESIDVRTEVAALASERVGGGTAGAELLEQSFGTRAERIVHAVPLGPDEAQQMADGHFLAMARRFVTGEVVADGDARIRVGTRVELVGVGPWFSGVHDVVATQHLFDLEQGYRTLLHVERAELML